MIPTLHTTRLVLDAFTPADAPVVELLASNYEVARHTLNIQHPYPPGSGVKWIDTHAALFERGEAVVFAIRLRGQDLIGAVGLRIERVHDRGELGYWIGQPYWGQGYATEAARACLDFGFAHYALNKVTANYVRANPASGRIMEKLGMKREGEHPQHTKRDGVYHDNIIYGMLRGAAGASPEAG